MLFNTPEFVIFFIVIITTIAIVKARKFQHLFLLFASYFFFYFSSNYLITLLIFTTIWDFYFGSLIFKMRDTRKKKAILVASLGGNLGLLGFFKYADFAITQFNFLGQQLDLGTEIPLLHLALPIAISFYTFHSITYTVSIYRGQMEPAKSFTEYAIFVAFFPQLVAGPILRAKEFLPQLREKFENTRVGLRQILIQNQNLKLGITMMAIGFLKKMFFADNIAPLVNEIFSMPIGSESFTIVLGAIAFGIQIYCDFSGYSDIAIGAAIILGFRIPLNFNKPYFATSPVDFWRRWHISLSSWLRDYLYIPLGGNKKGRLRTGANLIIVMFLGGLWHGASWNFVIWGLLHGAYLVTQKAILAKFPSLRNIKLDHLPVKIIAILATQYLIFLAWIPFRVNDTSAAFYSMYKYLIWDLAINTTTQTIAHNKIPCTLIVCFVALSVVSYKKDMYHYIANLKPVSWMLFLFAVMVAILFLYDQNPQDFIYFRF